MLALQSEKNMSCENCRKFRKCSRKGKRCILFEQRYESKCFICGAQTPTEEHHLFGAFNRKRSDKDGLTVRLCPDCHRTGKKAVHLNKRMMQALHKLGQRAYESYYGDGSFLKEYGRNYL